MSLIIKCYFFFLTKKSCYHIAMQTLRIIGGKWRSRRISFMPLKGLRPTTDAGRETLFNWLAQTINDANCLDLFAGSGALGFEALSRGAKHVVAVDSSTQVISNLKKTAQLLNTEDMDFYWAKIPQNLAKIPKQSFNIIFIDPPFYCDLIKPVCEQLENFDYLAQNGLVYIEAEKKLKLETVIPKSWQILRQKIAKQAGGYLVTNKSV